MAQLQGTVGPQRASDGATGIVGRLGKDAEVMVSMMNAKSYESAFRGRLFTAYATVTAPVIFSTAAGTGGPLIWNNSATINVVLLKVGFATSVVTTVATGLGITGNSAQTVAPTTTTAIDSGPRNLLMGGASSLTTQYRIGTPSSAGNFFIPFAQVHTGALTVDTTGLTWVDLEGSIIAPPQTWVSVAAGATATTLQVQVALIWAEVPV